VPVSIGVANATGGRLVAADAPGGAHRHLFWISIIASFTSFRDLDRECNADPRAQPALVLVFASRMFVNPDAPTSSA
jgi:hypothetical protein